MFYLPWKKINHLKTTNDIGSIDLFFGSMRIKSSITILILALSFAPINLYSQNASAQNMTDSNLTENATESQSVESFGRPEELADGNDQFSPNVRKIARELTKITPAEISHYPITNLSREDIVSVLGLLNPRVLTKVLLNIPQEDLIKMQDMLTPSVFTQTLNRLVEANKKQVEDRLSSVSAPDLQ
jgi:hypothetical protein